MKEVLGGAQAQPSSDRPSMRERVARAVCPEPVGCEVDKRQACLVCRNATDAALTALEGPTPEMVEAMARILRRDIPDHSWNTDDEIREAFAAAIRAARHSIPNEGNQKR